MCLYLCLHVTLLMKADESNFFQNANVKKILLFYCSMGHTQTTSDLEIWKSLHGGVTLYVDWGYDSTIINWYIPVNPKHRRTHTIKLYVPLSLSTCDIASVLFFTCSAYTLPCIYVAALLVLTYLFYKNHNFFAEPCDS